MLFRSSNMCRYPRFIPGLVLVILYTMIVLSPLTPVVLNSPLFDHTVIGECAGDCALCGCAPERSASHTCCCWLKKQSAEHIEEQNQSACCKKKSSDNKKTKTIISSRPCGSGKTAALAGMEQEDAFPYHFTLQKPVALESELSKHIAHCLIDWLGEPPDHPPKISQRI